METVYITGAEKAAETRCVATVGFFDGVHVGHRHVIGQVKELARRQGLRSCVVTFEKHPRQVVAPDFTPQLLTTLDEKLHLLDQLGVEVCAVLRFDRQMASMDAETFMQSILARTLGVRHLVIGYDNRFGHGRTEGFTEYAAFGQRMGMTVTACDEEVVEGQKVSSSLIRRCLAEGDVEKAAASLGYCYTLAGRVVGIVSPASSPMKRLREDARAEGRLIDATQGRKTRSILVTDSNHVILSSIQPETISQRFAQEETD